MSISDYQLFFRGTKSGTHHNGGYCSDTPECDIFEILENITWKEDVPNREFVEQYITDTGYINEDILYSFSKTSRECNGSGYCGCKTKITPTYGKLIKKNNIRDLFLEEVKYNKPELTDKPRILVSQKYINKHIESNERKRSVFSDSQLAQNRDRIHKIERDFIRNQVERDNLLKESARSRGVWRTHINSNGVRIRQLKPKFYSKSYRDRCATIPCKWGNGCLYINSDHRKCLFKH